MQNAQEIREHMEVIAKDGAHLGTVDHMDGSDRIKLTKTDPASGGQHHFIPLSWVDHIDQHVHLNKTSKDAQAQWQS